MQDWDFSASNPAVLAYTSAVAGSQCQKETLHVRPCMLQRDDNFHHSCACPSPEPSGFSPAKSMCTLHEILPTLKPMATFPKVQDFPWNFPLKPVCEHCLVRISCWIHLCAHKILDILKPLANVLININHGKKLSLRRFVLSGHIFPCLCLTPPSLCPNTCLDFQVY